MTLDWNLFDELERRRMAKKTKRKTARKRVRKFVERRKVDRRENTRSPEEFEAVVAALKTEQKLRMAAVSRAEGLAPFVWTCGDGRRMRPSEMDEQHLRNAISFLQRTIVSRFGNSTYIEPIAERCRAFYEMVKEARERGFQV